jgi:Virulence factor
MPARRPITSGAAAVAAIVGHRNNEAEMADLIVVYWRDIPAQVIVKKGRQNAKRELPLRFTEAIDMCAMRTGAGDTDAYLAEWRKGDPEPVGDDLEAEAEKALADIDATYTRERLVALVKAGGKEANV